MTPEIFAPGIISVKERNELNSVFSPKGDEFFFTAYNAGIDRAQMMFSKRVKGKWTKPELAPMSNTSEKTNDVDMAFSPDGNQLYFCSDRPTSWDPKPKLNIWYSNRTEKGWSKPICLEKPVNSKELDLYPSFTTNGTMYFSSARPGGLGDRDVYFSRWKDGKFSTPVRMGPAINSIHREGDTFISPDENYIIVTTEKRPDRFGIADLYISFKNKDGSWTPAKNMGKTLNTDGVEYCPMVTPNGKYFFFTRKDRKSRKSDIYWMDARFIDSLRQN
jgi:Tol biopolymer transport system component